MSSASAVAAAMRARARRWSESAAAWPGASPTSAPGGRRPSAIIRISASTAGESSGSPIGLGDAARRLAIPALLAVALAGCGDGSEGDETPAPVGGARECAERWNASGGEAVRYMSDVAEAGGEEAFVGSLDGTCVIYAQNPGDRGEVYVFEERGGQWTEPKRADVPQRRQLASNARILEGGGLALD